MTLLLLCLDRTLRLNSNEQTSLSKLSSVFVQPSHRSVRFSCRSNSTLFTTKNPFFNQSHSPSCHLARTPTTNPHYHVFGLRTQRYASKLERDRKRARLTEFETLYYYSFVCVPQRPPLHASISSLAPILFGCVCV